MDFSQGSISGNNGYGLQANFLNNKSAVLGFNTKSNSSNAFYAKKGEPMYMKEMDADEDGIVSFEEFKDYCEANGISPKEMVKMTEMANSYRIMQTQKKAEKAVKNNSDNENSVKDVESEAVYAKRGDSKYDEAMDSNNDDKVTYKEYIEYCKENAQPQEQKSNTKVEETENGEFKTTSFGKASTAYAKTEFETPEGKIEDTV